MGHQLSKILEEYFIEFLIHNNNLLRVVLNTCKMCLITITKYIAQNLFKYKNYCFQGKYVCIQILLRPGKMYLDTNSGILLLEVEYLNTKYKYFWNDFQKKLPWCKMNFVCLIIFSNRIDQNLTRTGCDNDIFCIWVIWGN